MTSEFKWDLGVKLDNQIKAGDLDAVAETTRETFENILISGTGLFEEHKLRTARALSMATRSAYEAGANPRQLIDIKNRSLENIIKVKTRKQLETLLMDETMQIAGLVGTEQDAIAERLPEAVKFIQEHATDGVTRSDVADILDCSPRHVSRLFSRVLGKHFKEFVLECRIDKSKQLLTNTDDKIVDIALAMGFSDQNYFGACFKRLTGVTPGQYRRSGGE